MGNEQQSAVAALTELSIIKEILLRLKSELADSLHYHTAEHSREVLVDAVTLALDEHIDPQSVELLAIAAAFHDAGFLIARKENEIAGAELAASAMALHGYRQDQIREVHAAIAATQLIPSENADTVVQIPTTPLSRYLIDADVANFGKPQFFQKSLLVFTELTGQAPTTIEGLLTTEQGRQFLRATLTMVKHHRWHTDAATLRFEEQKKRNIEQLERLSNSPGAQ